MIGKTVEHYRVTERLGAGGMGEVYRARDTKLERDVAIKVLPDGFAQNSSRRARFEREARLLAALNHPNVAAVYELTEVGGVHYLAMEYVPGRALRGPLPIEEALAVCRQVAEGLEAAHERGIIHRDLKPQNIVLTPEGKAKVLDFGLAKVVPEAVDIAQSPTMSNAHSEMGQVMGTVAYMSPEQARGRPLDRRTDIWAFGCLLYETLSGVRAFPGATHSDTLAAVLTSDPDERKLPPEVPPRVRELLHRCLRKDPFQRLRDIGDARLELEEAIAGNAGYPGNLPSLPRPWGTVRGRHLLLAALVLAVTAAGGWWLRDRWRGTKDAHGPLQVHRLTDFIGLEEAPAVSPDGKVVAFTAAVEGRKQIWVRLLAGGAPLQLTRDRVDHMAPRWTSDSGAILYHSSSDEAGTGGALFEIPALGGAARRVTDSLGEGDVSHDGKSIAYFASAAERVELRVCARDGSGSRTVARLEAHRYVLPRWSPDDRWIAYQRGAGPSDHVVEVTPSAGGEPRRAIEDGALLNGFTWLKDGSGFVYSSSRGSTIMYLPTFNLWSAGLGSDEARQITFGEGAYVEPDLAAGVLVASRIKRSSDIWKFPVDGTPRENVRSGVRITRQTGEVRTPSVGPGGREVVYLSESGGHGNLWILKVDGSGEARQITFESDPGTSMGVPVWSPDGRHIAYVLREADGSFHLWAIRPDGTGRRKVDGPAAAPFWSSDGLWLYYALAKGNLWQLVRAPAEGGDRVIVLAVDFEGPPISPDGRTAYYSASTSNGSLELRTSTGPGSPGPPIARIPGWRIPDWQIFMPVLSPKGSELAILLNDGPTTNLWAVSTSDGQLRQLTDFGQEPVFISRTVSWSADGRHLYAAVGRGDADVVHLSGLTLR